MLSDGSGMETKMGKLGSGRKQERAEVKRSREEKRGQKKIIYFVWLPLATSSFLLLVNRMDV